MGYVIAAIVLLLLPVILLRPYVGAVTYTVLAYLRPQDLAGDGVSDKFRLSLMVIAAMSAGLAMGWVRRKERPVVGIPWYGFVLAMIAAMFIASRTSIDVGTSTGAWLRFVQMLVGVALTVMLCGTPDRLRGIASAIALSLGAMAIYALAFPHWDDGRLAGGGGKLADSNDFALALDMALPLLVFLRRHETRRWLRWALAVPIPFVLVAIVLTYSRGGFLALAVVGLGWIFFSPGRMVRLLIAPVAVLLFLAVAPASYLDRLTTIDNYAHDQSALDRLSSWRVAERIFESHPWTGVGPGNFIKAYDRYTLDFQKPHVAHNAWLQIVADSGLGATIVFSLLIVAALVSAQRLGFKARAMRRRLLARGPEGRAQADRIAWVDDYAQGISVSLAAFVVGAQFLSKNNFDLVYLLTGLAGVLTMLGWRELSLERKTIVIRRTVRLAPRPSKPIPVTVPLLTR